MGGGRWIGGLVGRLTENRKDGSVVGAKTLLFPFEFASSLVNTPGGKGWARTHKSPHSGWLQETEERRRHNLLRFFPAIKLYIHMEHRLNAPTHHP